MNPSGTVRAFTSTVQITSRVDFFLFSLITLIFVGSLFLGVDAIILGTTQELPGWQGITFLFLFIALVLLVRSLLTIRAYSSLLRTLGHGAQRATVTDVETETVPVLGSIYRVYEYPFVTLECDGKQYSIFFMQENIDASGLLGKEVLVKTGGTDACIISLADGTSYRKGITSQVASRNKVHQFLKKYRKLEQESKQ